MNHCGRQQQLTYFSNTSNWTSFFNYNSNIVQANRSPKTPKKKKRQFDEFAKGKKMRNHNTTLNTIFMTFKHSFSNKILAYFTPSSMKGIFSLSLFHLTFSSRNEKKKSKTSENYLIE